MVGFFSRHTALQFIDGNAIPDFHGHSPQAATGGRSVCAAAFDGKDGRPKKTVVDIDGDGSFLMNCQVGRCGRCA